MNFRRTKNGNYINLDLVAEFGVSPTYQNGNYEIYYWYIGEDEAQCLPGVFPSEEDAAIELSFFLS